MARTGRGTTAPASSSRSLLPVCDALTPPARRWGCGCGHAKNRAPAGVTRKQLPAERFFELASPHPRAAGSPRDTTWGRDRVSRESVCGRVFFLALTQPINAGRGVRSVDSGDRAQIADGVRGPRADASESTRRAVCAAPCLSLHVKCLAGGLAFCVAAQGHAARRRLSERYKGALLWARKGPAWRRRAMQPGGVSANDTRSVSTNGVAHASSTNQPRLRASVARGEPDA